jgi:hypothetical protein
VSCEPLRLLHLCAASWYLTFSYAAVWLCSRELRRLHNHLSVQISLAPADAWAEQNRSMYLLCVGIVRAAFLNALLDVFAAVWWMAQFWKKVMEPVKRTGRTEMIAALKRELEKRVAENSFSGAVLIAKDGKPIFQTAYGYPPPTDTD